MSVSIENQLWLAAHLLYPNSSQAFDVYQAIMTQIINTPKNNNYQFIIEKLFEISQKVEPVKSNQPFHSLDGNPIDQWVQIYNKSQKNQLVIVIGVLIFKLSFAQIAQFSKLKPEKVYYLFQQVFKKNISLSTTPVRQTAIHLKKVTEQRVSFLFTYENLIDFCLETLNSKDIEQIKIGLQSYPELQVVEKKYKQIIIQLRNLSEKAASSGEASILKTIDFQPIKNQDDSFFKTSLTHHKKTISLAFVSVGIFILALMRPTWLNRIKLSDEDRFVTLQEVVPNQVVANHDGSIDTKEKMNLNEVAISSAKPQTNVVSTNNELETKPAAVAQNSKPDQTAEKHLIGKSVANASLKNKIDNDMKPNKQGGLFRGTLVVTDLNQVNGKIRDKIVAVGGQKAGEVELGWKKNPHMAYYHFTLPENNVEEVKSFLSQFGSLQLQFENHPRLIPAGVKRLIVEVKESE